MLAFSFCLVSYLSVCALLLAVNRVVSASDFIRYVALDGICGGADPCYATIQSAVDAASNGDTIKVSEGVYTSDSFPVVYIFKAVTIVGGYATTDWTNSLPLARPTVIDAENVAGRRGVYIDGTGVGTIALIGLTIQRGYVLDGSPQGREGAGLYIANGNVVLQENRVLNNTAEGFGGGLNIINGSVTLVGNLLQGNRAVGGGGLTWQGGQANLVGNVIAGNFALDGGGILITNGTVGTIDLSDNEIRDNNATEGGGINVIAPGQTVFMRRNYIQHNSAQYGGGLDAQGGSLFLDGNYVIGNAASVEGGGLIILTNINARNDIIAGNSSPGAGVYMDGGSLIAQQWTLADNGDYALSNRGDPANLINTIVAHHTYGGFDGSGISANYTLFFDSGIPCSNGAICSNNLFGDPKFVDVADGNFHIGVGSAAVDQGINTGITTDIDSQARPMKLGYDIGADEQPLPPPTPSFFSSGPDWVGETTYFTNTVVITGPAAYLWDFGDGGTSFDITPTHEYIFPGTFSVTLAVDNYGGSSMATGTMTIYAASFETNSPVWLGQATSFTNTTVTYGPTVYQWNFGDGTSSSQENPTHIYSLPGLYTVILTATNDAGSGVAINAITDYSSPTADFVGSPVAGYRPLTVVFTNTTHTIPAGDPTVTYSWEFGDGQGSALSDPMHTYTSVGVYTVTMSASNAAGSDTLIRPSYVTVGFRPAHADFTAWPTSGVAPLTTDFTNNSTGEFDSCTWMFGDGNTSDDCNDPSHVYTSSGSYTVTLSVQGLGGSDTMNRPGYIVVSERYWVYLPVVIRQH